MIRAPIVAAGSSGVRQAASHWLAGLVPDVMAALLALSGLVALLLLLLAVPIRLKFHLEGSGAFKGQVAVHWLFGVVRVCIPLPGAVKSRPESRTKPQAAKPRTKRRKPGARSRSLALLRHAPFRQRASRFINDLIRAVHPRHFRLSMRLGLGDPADTGCLWALVGPLNAAAQNLRNAHVQIEPEFMDTVFEFQADGQMRFVPLHLLFLAIAFALSPQAIRGWRSLRGNHARA